jgi:hypothetical protein
VPCTHAMLAKWIPPNERSRMGAFVYAGEIDHDLLIYIYMCVCVCVCVCVYIYIYIYFCVHTHIHTHTHTREERYLLPVSIVIL